MEIDERQLLKIGDLKKLIPVNRSTLWRWQRAGLFPAPVKLVGGRSIAWRGADILAWLDSRK